MADDTKLLAVIEANTKQFENALKRIETQTDRTFVRADRSVKRLDTSLKSSAASAARFGRSLGIAFSGAAAIAVAARTIRAFIQNTIESEAAIAQLNATLQSTGGAVGMSSKELQDLAASLQSVTVFSDEAIISLESQLATFTKISRDVFPQATEAILDLATKMGGDLKGAAVQVGKALQDPIAGITALRRVGVNFSDAQKTIIADLVKTGQLSKAQAIILKELQTEFGGSARAARDTLGGALKALSEAWGDLFEVSGPASDRLRLAIEQLITAIADPKFKEGVATIGIGLVGALEKLANILPQVAGSLTTFRQDTANFVADVNKAVVATQDWVEALPGAGAISDLGVALGVTDAALERINDAHEAVTTQADDLRLISALQKKLSIAPGAPAPATTGGGVGFVDLAGIEGETAAIEAEAAAIDVATQAAKEAEEERKRSIKELVRQKEAVSDLISDLEFEKSLIGLSNEERAVEVALRQAGAAATEEQRAQIASLVSAGLSEQQALDDLIDRMDEIRSVAGGALSAFNDALRNGEGLAGGLKSALDRVLDSVIRIAEQKLIESLFGSFGTSGGGGIGAIIGNLFGGGGGFGTGGGGFGGIGGIGSRAPIGLPPPAAAFSSRGGVGTVSIVNHGTPQEVVQARPTGNGFDMEIVTRDIIRRTGQEFGLKRPRNRVGLA